MVTFLNNEKSEGMLQPMLDQGAGAISHCDT
jgi:hypothetical protein